MISIIIVNYNVGKKILNCLKSIYESETKELYEIVVVENGSEDLKNKLKKFHNVTYVKSPENLGFGAGNNLGEKQAKGEYLFFLNPDTLVTKGSIDSLVNFYSNKKNIGMASPLLVDKSFRPFNTQSKKELTPTNAIFSFSFLRRLFPAKSVYQDVYFSKWDNKKPIKAEVVPGAAFFISKKLYESIGGFDEEFFLYFEEYDLSKKVRELGFDLYILPEAKVVHEVGQSTKMLENRTAIFEKSRYLFLRKHYGITKAIATEIIIRFNPILFIILLAGLFLRINNISNNMPFIGDFAWFYISAKNMLVNGIVPLVGITSSHVWLHQGALWTYILSIFLWLFKFNPISGAYLTITFGVLSTYLIYVFAKNLYSKKVGIVASAIYATSPLIVNSDRTPYHTSPIPFFVLIYLYSLSKWFKGDIKYFPIAILSIVILYNFELATFTLFFPFVLLFIYGFFYKKDWIFKLNNSKTIIYSALAFLIPMFPILIYDFSNGFKQTVVFLGWTIYKPISGLLSNSSISSGTIVGFLTSNISRILFVYSKAIAVVLFIISLIYLVGDQVKTKNKITNSKFVLILLLFFSFCGILINKTPSDAYLPMTFPLIILSVSLFLSRLSEIKSVKYVTYILLVVMIFSNFFFSYTKNKSTSFRLMKENVAKILALTKNKPYVLIGKGPGSQFESFTMNYQYLLWISGSTPSKTAKLKVIIEDNGNRIEVND